MKHFFHLLWQKYRIGIFLIVLIFLFFQPVFLHNKTLLSSNFLVAFYNPWAQEKFVAWPQGVPYKPVGVDNLRIFLPQREFTKEMFALGQLPFWNPYSFSGNYHLGLSETAIFYPLFFLFSIVSGQNAWLLLLLVQPVLAFMGMYLFLRLILIKKVYALFGATVFGFSGIVLVRMIEGLSVGHALVWLPFALWAVEGFFQKGKVRYLFYLLFAMILSVLAGWFQFSFYLIVCAFLYSVWRIVTTTTLSLKRKVFIFLPFFLLPLLTLPHTIPSFETFLLSPRDGITFADLKMHLMPVQHLLTLFYPDYWGNPAILAFFGKSEYKESIMYVGVIPVFLALFSLTYFRHRVVQFFGFLTIISLLLGIENPFSLWFLSLKIPIVSSFLPDRIFLLTSFSLALLSAYGLQYVVETKKHFWLNKFHFFFFFVVGMLVCFNLAVFSHLKQGSFLVTFFRDNIFSLSENSSFFTVQVRNIFLGDVLIAALFSVLFLRRFLRGKGTIVALFILTIIGQIYFSYKYLPFADKSFVFPSHQTFSYLQQHQEQYRFITSGDGYIMSEIPLYYHVYSPDGVSSMYPKRYGELVTYALFAGNKRQTPRVETRINPSPESLLVNNDPYVTRFMQIDGIKYVLLRKSDFIPSVSTTKHLNQNWQLVWQDTTWQIYTYNKVLPRFFWTDSFTVVNNDQALLKAIYAESVPSKNIFLEKNPGFVSNDQGKGDVRLQEYSPNVVSMRVNATNDGLVYLSDSFAPNFKVYVDGKPTEVLRANYAFRAVPVTKGNHTISFRYEDHLFITGCIIALVSGIIVLLSFILLKWRKIIIW